MKRLIELTTTSLVSLGVFYLLALHAIQFPIFKGKYILAQDIVSGDKATLTVFAGTNTVNLIVSVVIAICIGILTPYLLRAIWELRKLRLTSKQTTKVQEIK